MKPSTPYTLYICGISGGREIRTYLNSFKSLQDAIVYVSGSTWKNTSCIICEETILHSQNYPPQPISPASLPRLGKD